MKKILIFIYVIVAAFYGCEKNYVNVPQSLVGKWTWVSTCGGIAGICYTPQSTGQNNHFVFTADSVFYYYVNDTLKNTGVFHVYKILSENNKSLNILQAGSWDGEFTVTNDILSWPIHSDCFDCFESAYKRIR